MYGYATVCAVVMGIRDCLYEASGRLTWKIRPYVCSARQTRMIAYGSCDHWYAEQDLHWVLDVAFREDAMRVRHRVLAENLAVMKRLGVSSVRADRKTPGLASVPAARKRPGTPWGKWYLRCRFARNEVPEPWAGVCRAWKVA